MGCIHLLDFIIAQAGTVFVIIGIGIHQPEIEMALGQNVPRGEHPGRHGVVAGCCL